MAKHEKKTYVVTSAQSHARVNNEFLTGLKKYCKDKKAELIVLPMAGRTIKEQLNFDEILESHIYIGDKKLNEKIRINRFDVAPQNMDPTTSLGRFTQSDVSTIFASPKQRLKVIPNSNIDLPKVLMTTGAVTHPHYQHNRWGNIAKRDHVYGAIVVEIENDNIYHYRQLNAQKNGHFVDMGLKYMEKKKSSSELEAMVLGDWHCGDTNPDVRKATFEMIKELKPKRVVLHDFFDGRSVNYFNRKRPVIRAKDQSKGRLSLEDELKFNSKELFEFRKQLGYEAEIVIPAANHHDFLTYYLGDEKPQYMKEPQNTYIGSILFTALLDGKNPLQAGLEWAGGIPENVKFLRRDEDYKVLGWQLGSHGDKGANGSKGGGVNGKETGYGKGVFGHTHTPEIMRNTYVVGTSTYLDLDYKQGTSSWMNTHGLLWKVSNTVGKVQLVNIIDGKYRGK